MLDGGGALDLVLFVDDESCSPEGGSVESVGEW